MESVVCIRMTRIVLENQAIKRLARILRVMEKSGTSEVAVPECE